MDSLERLVPGPELDAAVCRAIGWDACRVITNDGVSLEYPAVSTDWHQMGRFIAAMRERGFGCRMEINGTDKGPHYQTTVLFYPAYLAVGYEQCFGSAWLRDERIKWATGDSLPHAAARAALAALTRSTE